MRGILHYSLISKFKHIFILNYCCITFMHNNQIKFCLVLVSKANTYFQKMAENKVNHTNKKIIFYKTFKEKTLNFSLIHIN
jgi:hypothetical protein